MKLRFTNKLKADSEVNFSELNGKTFYQYSIFNSDGEFQLAGDTSNGKLKVSGGRIIARTKEAYIDIKLNTIKDAFQDENVVYIKTKKLITISFHLDK